jgi:hypothetical protein
MKRFTGKISSQTLLTALSIAACCGPVAASPSRSDCSALDGAYNVIAVSEREDASGFLRASGFGELRIDSRRSTFRVEYNRSTTELSAICDYAAIGSGPCYRHFIRHRQEDRIRYEGKVGVTADGVVSLELSERGDAREVVNRSLAAFVDRDDTALVIPLEHQDGSTLIIAMRKPRPGIRSTSSAAAEFAYSVRDADFPFDIASNGGNWNSYLTSIRAGTLRLAGSQFEAEEHGSIMDQSLSCLSAAGGCSTVAMLNAMPIGPLQFGGGAYQSPEGAIEFTAPGRSHRSRSVLRKGFLTSKGELAALLDANLPQSLPPRGLTLAVRRGGSHSSSEVAGTYNAVALEEFFDSDSGVRLARVVGQIVLTPEGTWDFTGTDSALKRTECTGEADETCPIAGMSGRSVAGGAGGQFTVSSAGDIVMEGLAGDNTPRTFSGEISRSGSFMTLRRSGDGAPCSFDCTGTQSFRSLILAVKR